MKVLNLFSGVGGNRKLWKGCDVTAVEMNERIARVYERQYLLDDMVVGDAHQYLLDHYATFDFIWSSPPCQTHSRMNKATRHPTRRYFDVTLWQEIVFLQHFCKTRWVVENVVPYYEPLVPPTKQIGRHLFWSNFPIEADEVPQPANFINRADLAGKEALMEWLGIRFEEKIYYGTNHCPAQILRNCVHPKLGLQVFQSALMADPMF